MGSTVPAVKAYLTAAWSAAIGDVTVSNTIRVANTTEQDAIIVGHISDIDPAAVTGQLNREVMGGRSSRDLYTINCRITTLRPGSDLAAAETRVFDILGQMGVVLGTDLFLGGLVNEAQFGPYTLSSVQSSSGALAILVVGVAIDAFMTT